MVMFFPDFFERSEFGFLKVFDRRMGFPVEVILEDSVDNWSFSVFLFEILHENEI